MRQLIRLPYFIGRGIKYHAAERFLTPKPKLLGFNVTRKCNSRCNMCSIWKTGNHSKELALGEIREILSNPLFDSLQGVILTGGEPTLRQDLVQVAEAVLHTNPRIMHMQLITNGLKPSIVVRRIKDVLELPACSRLSSFTVAVSLDGWGITHEKIRGVPQAFDRVMETLKALKYLQLRMPFNICLNCAVQPLNVSDLPQLSKFAWEQGFPINIIPTLVSDFLIDNIASKDQLILNDEQLNELKGFWQWPRQHNLGQLSAAFWQDYFHIIQGKKRRVPCALVYHGVTMDADGTLFICAKDESLIYGNVRDNPADKIWYSEKAKEMRNMAKKSICTGCYAAYNISFALSHEFFYFAKFLAKEISKKPANIARLRL